MTKEIYKNVLYIGCGDKRLWKSHTHARAEVKKETGCEPYNLLVPGPDECVHGDDEHLSGFMFFVKRFYDLTEFDLIKIYLHGSCAGCTVSDEEHRQFASKLGSYISETDGLEGAVDVYFQEKPEVDEYGIWPNELVYTSKD